MPASCVTQVLYREARRSQDLRDRRCRDERSDPSDALRGPSRYPAGAAARRTRARSAPTWSGRSANPATISRSIATCRSPSPATCSRSCPRAPMARCRPGPTTPARWCRGAGQGDDMVAGPPPPRSRRIDRARSDAALAVSWRELVALAGTWPAPCFASSTFRDYVTCARRVKLADCRFPKGTRLDRKPDAKALKSTDFRPAAGRQAAGPRICAGALDDSLGAGLAAAGGLC